MIERALEDYLRLVTAEHRNRPLFLGVLSAAIAGNQASVGLLQSMLQAFDLDSAVGVQLDVLGIWVGRSRDIKTPLAGLYFSWDDTEAVGWGRGLWKGPFDATVGLTRLPDEEYRKLLRGKIAANNWDGSIYSAQKIWDTVFDGEQKIVIQDKQDMSMMVGFVGEEMTPVQQALLTGGYFPLKPAGVRIAYYAIPVNDGPLFAWDTASDQLAGWGSGSWPKEIVPT